MDIRLYETQDLVKAICQLTEKLYGQNRRLQIICANPLMVTGIDQALWQFKQLSFIPHMTDLDQVDPMTQPIFITTCADQNLNQAEIIIACNTVPSQIHCESLIGICDSSVTSAFKASYTPDQCFVQMAEGGWKSC